MTSHGLAEIAQVDQHDLQRSEVPLQNWEELLRDPDRIEWLLFVSQHYTSLFETAITDCIQLMGYDNVCYLLDFDVLRHHLEVNSGKDLDMFAVNSLFYSSKQKYALPLGAFLEFMEWLNNTGLIKQDISELTISLDREGFIHEIAKYLGIQNPKELDDEEAANEILKRLDRKFLLVTRLLNILTDPRFIGVVSEYDNADADKLAAMFNTVNRRNRKGPRRLVDERDAMNLAIAIKGVREAKRQRQANKSSETTGYILITQTKAVLELSKRIEEEIGQDLDFMSELFYILGKTGPIVHGMFPAMHPRQVINAELLGVYKNPQKTIMRIKNLRRDFQTIEDHFLTEFLISKTLQPETLYNRVIGPFIEEERQIVSDAINSVSTKMLSTNSVLYQLEQKRLTGMFLESTEHKTAKKDSTSENEVRKKSIGFLDLLGQLCLALKEIPGFEYRVTIEDSNNAQPFRQMTVLQEPVMDGVTIVINGEIYNTGSYQCEHKKDFYVVRWPIAGSESKFITAIERIVVPVLRRQSNKSDDSCILSLEPIAPNSTLWDEGVIIFSGDEAYGTRIGPFLEDNGWNLLRRSLIATYINKGTFESGEIGTEESKIVSNIQQYRINTLFGDFIYEMNPAEGEDSRYLTIISHYNLGTQIALFYRYTGTFFVLPTKLSAVLTEALSEFEELTH